MIVDLDRDRAHSFRLWEGDALGLTILGQVANNRAGQVHFIHVDVNGVVESGKAARHGSWGARNLGGGCGAN